MYAGTCPTGQEKGKRCSFFREIQVFTKPDRSGQPMGPPKMIKKKSKLLLCVRLIPYTMQHATRVTTLELEVVIFQPIPGHTTGISGTKVGTIRLVNNTECPHTIYRFL